MRILFIGSTQGTSCALHYFTALARLGHSVLPYDPQFFSASHPWEAFWMKLRHAPSPAKVALVGEEIKSICQRNPFDMVFVMAENFLDASTLQAIRSGARRAPLFVYHSHDNNFSDGILKPQGFFETLARYDCVFTTKSQNVARYRALGQNNAHFLPSAFEPSVHYPVAPAQSRLTQDFDATFIGTFDHSRAAYFEAVGWDRLNVWGGLWDRWAGYSQHQDRIVARPIYYFEFADVMSKSRCALGLLREEAGDLHTQRTFEIPACGAFQLAPRNAEILSFFEENREIACFDSLEELKSKVDFYLKHETERKKIAEAGYQRCVRSGHTYEDRVREMVAIAANEPVRQAKGGG